MQKPANAKGTRDFSPEVVKKRTYILSHIKSVFHKFGFEPIQTPALENLSTLMGKYGEEGDKLLFKVLNSGDISSSIRTSDVEEGNNSSLIASLSEKGLRYDLTVPFARYVVQHRNDINFPFRRYQIQEVWRADRPQKGRYREFTQCDADVIGSPSMINEADLILIYNEVFNLLKLPKAVLKINHRKLLEALVDELKLDFPVTVFTSTLDKLDKIGVDGVSKELQDKGVSVDKCEKLFSIIDKLKLDEPSLQGLLAAFNNNSFAQQAVADLQEIRSLIESHSVNISIELDLSLARGLDYYTGCIFEAMIPDSGIGSVSGGGRYDDLTGVFGLSDVSGVGISFGIDRLYDIMERLDLFDLEEDRKPNVLFLHFDEKGRNHSFSIVQQLRAHGIKCEAYPDIKKLKKQMEYANRTNRSHVVVIGDNEMENGIYGLKDMGTGNETKVDLNQMLELLR